MEVLHLTGSRGEPTPAGLRFLDANRKWWENSDYLLHKDIANAIYSHLVNRVGCDPNEDDTYAEVASRLKTFFPDLAVVSAPA